MTDFFIGVGAALWLGILTSISPCPLATNIAAISFLSKKILHVKMVFWAGLAYTVGRMVVYATIGYAIISSLLSVPAVAQFLQVHMGKVLGPALIISGLFLLDVVSCPLPGVSLSEKHRTKLAEAGLGGAFVLGAFFALVFCPVSAALFFGSLIPLALSHEAGVVLPFIYGLGTGLPVLAFAVAIALGATSLSHWFNKVTQLEQYTRRITGFVFILAGMYYIWMHFLT